MNFTIHPFVKSVFLNFYNRFNATGRKFERTHIRTRKQKIKEVERGRKDRLAEFIIALSRAEDTLNAEQKRQKTLRFQEKLFTRNFQSEIEKYLNIKSSGYEAINRLKFEISDAYEDLNFAKKNLDNWYRKSKGNFIGNGGRKLPRHALFGQSTGDRDSLKYRKDLIYRKIQGLKKEKNQVYDNEIKFAKKSIGKIREDQRRLKALRAMGETKETLYSQIESQSARVSESEDRVAQAHEFIERQNVAIDNEILLIKEEIRKLWAQYKEKNI